MTDTKKKNNNMSMRAGKQTHGLFKILKNLGLRRWGYFSFFFFFISLPENSGRSHLWWEKSAWFPAPIRKSMLISLTGAAFFRNAAGDAPRCTIDRRVVVVVQGTLDRQIQNPVDVRDVGKRAHKHWMEGNTAAHVRPSPRPSEY